MCNNHMPPDYAMERLPLECQDYRLQNHWPRKVAEEFNQQYDLARYGNGGSNHDLNYILKNLHHNIFFENLDLIIFQFTNSGRNPFNENTTLSENLEHNDFLESKNTIQYIEKTHPNIKIIYLSWLPELSNIIVNELGEKYLVNFDYKNKSYNNFEDFYMDVSLSNQYKGLLDHHFNLEGHSIIANGVINHIKKYNLI